MSWNECAKHPGNFGESNIQTGYYKPCPLCQTAGWRRLEQLGKVMEHMKQLATVVQETLVELNAIAAKLRAGGGTEPHDGDVSRLLRLWAKPLRGLLNRPDDALALERAADVIESGGMDSVFRVSRSPTGEETHERT